MSEIRVVHKTYGAGKVIQNAFIGLIPVTYVKFDSQKEEMLIPDSELEREIKKPEVDNDPNKRAAREKELETCRADSLAEVREIKDMDNINLIDRFEYIVRHGAGPCTRRVVLMKREILRRMDRGDSL